MTNLTHATVFLVINTTILSMLFHIGLYTVFRMCIEMWPRDLNLSVKCINYSGNWCVMFALKLFLNRDFGQDGKLILILDVILMLILI